MCTGGEILAVASLITAGSSVVTAAKAGQKVPPKQEAKKPDIGVSEEERRSRLLAQLAAGASKTNPTGGKAGPGTFSTGNVQLGV